MLVESVCKVSLFFLQKDVVWVMVRIFLKNCVTKEMIPSACRRCILKKRKSRRGNFVSVQSRVEGAGREKVEALRRRGYIKRQ